MDRFDDDTLFAELRELRPTPRPEFAAELDERAAAGFPRGADTTASVFAPIVDWWRGMNLRRRLIPVLGFAIVAVIVATGAVAISQSGGGASSGELHLEQGGSLSDHAPESSSSESVESGAAAGGEAAPTHSAKPSHAPAQPSAPSSEVEGEELFEPEGSKSVGRAESAAGGRDIERSSHIVLGTKPGEVSGVAAKVYEAVHAAHGFVLSSSVQSGTTGATGASFELSI